MDKIIDKIVGLGVPGLVLVITVATTGLAGGAAIVTALAALGGPLGMAGGIAALGALTLIASGLSKYGFDSIMQASIRGLYLKGETKESIISKVKKYPISKDLKNKLIHEVENFRIS